MLCQVRQGARVAMALEIGGGGTEGGLKRSSQHLDE
jgi:hypothetical protein